MKFPRSVLVVSVLSALLALAGCGGGGGGGGGSSATIPVLRTVPFSTPALAGYITPLNTTKADAVESGMFAANLSGNGQEVVVAGRSGSMLDGYYPTYNLNVFGWDNGKLVNKTSQWFSNQDNVIVGTEPSVKFADFNNDGKLDMYVSPNTDTGITGSGWVFLNNGSNFTRVNLNLDVSGHDSAVYDINKDGTADIFTTGSRVTFGSTTNNFTTHVVTGRDYGGTAGSVAIADFMGDGSSSIILTDQNSWQAGNNKLYSWRMVNGGRSTLDFDLSVISTLPNSRFLLPKWNSYGFVGSHDYRTLALDFDNSGLTSAIIFSRPVQRDSSGAYVWNNNYSEIQFLKNQGGGVFTDVTDTTLVGYKTSAPPQYNPTIMDVNGDGLPDIVLGRISSGTGAQVLIRTKENKYVASYGTVIDAFVSQSLDIQKAIIANANSGSAGIVFVNGPDGNMYLATAVSYSDTNSSVPRQAIYLSKLGATTASAQATASAIKQAWPWMSDSQVNAVLAQSSTQWLGMNLLDPSKAFQPMGSLSIAVANKGLKPIDGYIAGVNVSTNSVVFDSMGRAFSANLKYMSVQNTMGIGRNTEHVDQYNLTSHAEYLVNGAPVTINNLRLASETRMSLNGSEGPGPSATTMPSRSTQYSFGVSEIYKKNNWSYGAQFTSLNSNPWIAFGGSWGSINSSTILDNVFTYKNQRFSAQASLMHVSTNINPGLITRVNNIWGAWGELGLRFNEDRSKGDLGVYVGVKPVVLSGSVEARLPTGVDMQGNVQYTNQLLNVQSQTVPYVRVLYNKMLNRNTMFKFGAMTTATNNSNQFRVTTEFKHFF